jgi:hypothetical protein
MNCALNNTRKPDITFHSDGRIEITARVTKALSIHPGDVIDIAHDGSEHYLYVKHHNAIGRHEAQCYPTYKGKTCNNLRAHSKRLCMAVLNVNGNDNEARLPVGEPMQHNTLGTALPIIIHHNLDKR